VGEHTARAAREPRAARPVLRLDAGTPLDDLLAGELYVLVIRGDDAVEVLAIAPGLGAPQFAIAWGEAESVPDETVEVLIEAGLLVHVVRRPRSPAPRPRRPEAVTGRVTRYGRA
jgi:hypothetical protein